MQDIIEQEEIKEPDKIKFNGTCPVCECKDIKTEECLGPRYGKGFREALTGDCMECFAGFEVISGKIEQIREGRICQE